MIKKVLSLFVILTFVFSAQAQQEEPTKEVAKAITELKLDQPTHEEPVSVETILLDSDEKGEKNVMIRTNIMDGYKNIVLP